MCLYIKSGPHVADKNIYTLKAAEKVTLKDCESFCQEVTQEYGKLLKSKLVRSTDYGVSIIENGLHSVIGNYNNTIVSFRNINCNDVGVILCKIPKGSTYYIGKHGDIVSDKLILIEPIIAGNNLLDEPVKDMFMYQALQLAEKIVKSYGIKIGL